MRTYWNYNKALRTLEEWQPDCWVQVTCPTLEDEEFLFNELNVPSYFLDDIRDKDERSRFEYDEGWQLIILRIPYVKEVRSRTPHTTIPLGIILKKGVCVTVCNHETNMMIDFVSYQQKRNMGFTDSVDLVFRLFLSSAVWYLKRLKQINVLIEEAKRQMRTTSGCHFIYKKANGEIREAFGTLNHAICDKHISGRGISPENWGCCCYWDMEKGGFRSFRWENLIAII